MNIPILTVRDADGNITTVPAIRGEKGEPGKDGAAGKDGVNGTSVTVASVKESSADGGENIITFSDGKTVTIRNGSKGSAGTNGNDYVLSEADKTDIAEIVLGLLPNGDEVSY